MAVLEVKNLVVHYGKVEALKSISFEVEEGEIVTLIGANGAGKSTVLNALSGLNPATSGEIRFLGPRIDNSPPEVITGLGLCLIPEGKRLFPYLTVVENLKVGAFLRKDKIGIQESIDEQLERFPELKRRAKLQAGKLSGGEQQMLAFARGLMAKPKLLMLDEPSIGLAPLIVEKLFMTIVEINKMGITILLVEQNAAMALEIADKGYVLETGRCILEGSAKELSNNDSVKRAYLGG